MFFRADQAASIAGCSPRQLRYWKETGLIRPAMPSREDQRGGDLYDFRNLVELRTVVGMLHRGISLQKIRKTLEYLRRSTDFSRPLSECKLITDGVTIFRICSDQSAILDTLRQGQIALCIALDGIAEELKRRLDEWKRDREAFIRSILDKTESTTGPRRRVSGGNSAG